MPGQHPEQLRNYVTRDGHKILNPTSEHDICNHNALMTIELLKAFLKLQFMKDTI